MGNLVADLQAEATADVGQANKTKTQRGPRPRTDKAKDRRIADAWNTGNYRTYAELGRELGVSSAEVKQAIDRARKR